MTIREKYPKLVLHLNTLYSAQYSLLHRSGLVDPKDTDLEEFCTVQSENILDQFIHTPPAFVDIRLWFGLSRWESPNGKALACKDIKPNTLYTKLEESKASDELAALLLDRRESNVGLVQIQTSEETYKLLKWIFVGAAKADNRPVLTNLYFHEGKVVACDGYRLHCTKIPGDFEQLEGLYFPVFLKGNVVELWPITIGKFPDVESIIPRQKPVKGTDQICLDASMLSETTSGIDPYSLRITIGDTTTPVILQGNVCNHPVFAIIMPMSTSRDVKTYWSPLE